MDCVTFVFFAGFNILVLSELFMSKAQVAPSDDVPRIKNNETNKEKKNISLHLITCKLSWA